MKDDETLCDWARRAASGDQGAATQLVEAIQDDLYRLALCMLGHPQDAEDAMQEILLIIITHLGSFRGESAFSTWAWRVASNHLLRVRKGRRETLSFESLGGILNDGLSHPEVAPPEAEENLFAEEIRLRCTQGMLLCLDRELRIAYLLADIFGLDGAELFRAAEIFRDTPDYAAPPTFVERIRQLLDSGRLELLKN
jgi:RNA polymerase sigma factor (sigma-70 family)